jgi:hypothetical protein
MPMYFTDYDRRIDRDLVKIYHPDKMDPSVPSDVAHARFQAIATAYGALSANSSVPGDRPIQNATPTARAMYKRSRNLYSGPQLADESWKDRIMVAGLIFVRNSFDSLFL